VPRPVLDRLNAAVNEALRRDSARWAEVVKRSGAKID